MPIHVTQLLDDERKLVVLRVEGEMLPVDAALLKTLAVDVAETSGMRAEIDLSDLDFLDSESAPILIEIQKASSISINSSGLLYFIQKMVEEAERKG